jgi:hypothetical protein
MVIALVHSAQDDSPIKLEIVKFVYKVSKNNEGVSLHLLITKIGVNETGYWIIHIYQ